MTRHTRFGFAGFLLLLAPIAAEACSCVSNTRTPCQTVPKDLIAFVGTVIQVDEKPVDASGVPLGRVRYTFTVEEELFGINTSIVEVYASGLSCDYHFTEGEQYIVFPDRSSENGRLYSYMCGSTAPLESAQHVLSNYRALRDGKEVPTISGILWNSQQFYKSIRIDGYGGPVPDTVIQLVRESSKLTTTTDVNGAFSFYQVPPGNYRISVELPPYLQTTSYLFDGGLRIDEQFDGITVEGDACYEGLVLARPTGKIQGRVVDSDGETLRKASLSLFLIDRYGDEYGVLGTANAYQREFKDFEFEELLEGEYLLVYNEDDDVNPNSPYPRTYYPGVREREAAIPIVLTKGEQRLDVELYVRDAHPTRKLTVKATWEDGSPASEVSINAEGSKGWRPKEHEIEPGLYVLNLLIDADYTIYASEWCPNLRRYALSEKVTLHGSEEHINELQLMLPGANCKESPNDLNPQND